ncbi:MAG: hypothetical protein OZ924_18540, partial [Burkholderiaceae bacterium]|nr:hypothetical protein [Burkholderiaceae bacterium]
CIAVLVPAADGGRSNMGLAVQAPIMRLTASQAVGLLPVLRRAALDLVHAGERPEADACARGREDASPPKERRLSA